MPSQEALQRHEFFRDCLAAQRISLKMASQVMLLRNLELTGGASKMLVNGSRGVIAYFLTREEARTKLLAEIKEARATRCAVLKCERLTLGCEAGQERPGRAGCEHASAPPFELGRHRPHHGARRVVHEWRPRRVQQR